MNQIVSPMSPNTAATLAEQSPTSTAADTSDSRSGETVAPRQQVTSDGGCETAISSPSQSAGTAEVAAGAADNDSTVPSANVDHAAV